MNTIWTPMDERSRQRQFEDSFFRQLRARATKLIHGPLPADRVVVESMPDGRDAVRAALNRLEIFDLDLLNELPGTRAVSLEFGRQLIWPLSYTVARVRAQVLTPTAALVSGETPRPIGRDQVQYALDRYELLPTNQRPTAVILASATGFTPEARAMVTDSDLPKLVLVGGREDGGWDVEMSDSVRYSPWAQLVEFETQDDQVRRLLYHLDKEAAALESRGLALSKLSDKLGLPQEQTEAAVRQACRSDPRLMTVVHEGELHVARSPLADEVGAMSLWMRIRRLFGFKPSTAERVRIMTAQRVQLEQQREELDRRLDALEAEERESLQKGAAAATEAEKKQLAGKLVRVRRDLRRIRAQVNVFTQQIDIIGTHVHNLTLAEQGRRLELPKAEDLTREAAEAEQIVAELAANADLAAGIEVGVQTPLQADEEDAILAEFAQVAEAQAAAKAAPAAAGAAGPEPEAPSRAKGAEGSTGQRGRERAEPRPEIG
ncbi:MAG: hypothetical protein GX547_06140 [Phycisphaerae bacterium]|nr:hypothetical protein [Phycisphaerae bacterium]